MAKAAKSRGRKSAKPAAGKPGRKKAAKPAAIGRKGAPPSARDIFGAVAGTPSQLLLKATTVIGLSEPPKPAKIVAKAPAKKAKPAKKKKAAAAPAKKAAAKKAPAKRRAKRSVAKRPAAKKAAKKAKRARR